MDAKMQARLEEWLTPSPDELLTRKNLRAVLKWALAGRPKPSRYVGGYRGDMEQFRLGCSLYAATNPNNARFYGQIYNREFDELLRALRPDWFLPISERFNEECRAEWVERAKAGLPKPGRFSPSKARKLGIEMELRRLRPEWFVTPRQERWLQSFRERKVALLEKARLGQTFTHAERQYLYSMRRPDHPIYDPEFTKLVDSYRPTRLAGSIFRKEGA